MNTTTRVLVAILGLAVCSFGTGCATIVKGTTQEIPVSSDPTGARINVDGAPAGTTPATVTLSRKTNHMVTIEKEGFRPESVAITKSMGGAVAGNIIAGGLVGWGVDAVSGAQYNLNPKTVSVRLQPITTGEAPAVAATNGTKEFIDELNKLDGLLEQKKVTPEEHQKMKTALIEKYHK